MAVRESREQRDAGRIRMSSLNALLAEGAAAELGADAQRIDTLASKYGVDAETLGEGSEIHSAFGAGERRCLTVTATSSICCV